MDSIEPLRPEPATLIENRWDDAHAATLDGPNLLLYRSNLLGADKRVTNFGGGNTSSKLAARDPLTGETVMVLWVKGSGGDIGTMKLDGFSTLYMERMLALQNLYRGPEQEDEIVGLYPHCTFNLNPRATSIDTPLHGLVNRPHVDHVHPDAVIAIAASEDSQALTREIYGGAIGWLPWRRPGFELGLWLKRFHDEHPNAEGVVLEAHGLFTWADDQKSCYQTTIDTINRAASFLADRARGRRVFGGPRRDAEASTERHAVASRLLPLLRGRLSQSSHKVAHFDDSDTILDFVDSHDLATLAPLGTSCPDHFLRTKIRPLVLDFDTRTLDDAALSTKLDDAVADYRADYTRYYERCRHENSPALRDPNPVIHLIPGIGMAAFAADRATARIAAEFYTNAINVMRGSSTVSTYRGLPEQEAFDIEYWLLEEAKLQRMPKPKALAGRVALITGGAGGIGIATARRLLDEGACVVLTDIDADALRDAETTLQTAYGADSVASLAADVTSEAAVADTYRAACLHFGGIDICVSNAGIASASPIEDTTLDLWNRNQSILATGYFLVAREAFRVMKAQGIGGSIIFVASKNGLVASPGAAAYCTAKAAEIQLARCIALEGAPHGIRCNVVNPDAVLRGSRIWAGEWGDQRAASYKTSRDELEAIYRDRSLLKRSVYPEDIAEGIAFFATERSAKSTGNILNVDAGNAASFTR